MNAVRDALRGVLLRHSDRRSAGVSGEIAR